MIFKIGQKVVCIIPDDFRYLKKDAIYEVRDYSRKKKGILLKGVVTPENNDNRFRLFRFKPLEDDWANNLLTKILEETQVQRIEHP